MEDNIRSCFGIITITLLTIGYFAIKPAHAGTLSFCDGTTYMEKTREQCGAGITFGENKPDCICVSGVYRFIADSCETADGFAEQVCTKLSDDNGLGASIVGVKFTRDPVNWSQTGIVCERKGFGTETWDFITDRHSRGSTTKSTNIYAVNGKAYMIAGHHDKQAFCVEPAKLPESERICRYLKSENEKVWKETEVEVVVKGKCDGLHPKLLTPHKCFGLLTTKDSECSLTCSPRSPASSQVRPMGRSFSGMGRSMGGSPTPAAPGKGENKKGKGAAGKGGKANPTSPAVPGPTPVDDPSHPTEYWKHDNKYLNRKMMIYNIISQLNTDNSTNSTNSTTYGEPKRTFELFDMMKDITEKYCPQEYVFPEWMDLVIDLFYIIHKGNIFKYDENLSEGEYDWIKDILTKCHDRVTTEGAIELTTDPTLPDPEEVSCHPNGGGLATGFCNGTKPDGSGCNFIPVVVQEDRANDSFHYVPEVAWDIVDIIQVICFPEFNVSYRMFHVLEQAAEKLFTLQVKNLWYYPNWSEKTKKRLLGTSADMQMHNLEVCIYSAYYMNGQIPRLVRPKPVKYLRKKRSVSNKQPVSEGTLVDVYCSKSRKEFNAPTATTCPQD